MNRFIGLAAAGLVATSALSGAAMAQTSEIEMLREQLRAMQQRLDRLEESQAEQARKTDQAVAAAKAAGGDPTLESGNDKVSLKIRGQVSRAVMYGDNGDQSDVLSVDNDASSSRFGFYGTANVTDDFSMGSNIELEVQSDASNNVGFESSGSSFSFGERIIDVYLQSKTFGKLTLGQSRTASDGGTEVDLSGTDLVGYSDMTILGGGFAFNNGGPVVGDVQSNFDGLSRDDVVRYDTPKFAGIGAATSFANDSSGSKWDVAGTFDGDFGDLGVSAKVFFASENGTTDRYGGSASVLHSSGVNATVAYAEQDRTDTRDPVFVYGKLGYIFSAFSFGKTAIAVDYGYNEDVSTKDDEFTGYGIHAVQKIDPAAAEVYVGLRNYELDRTGATFDDVFAAMAGARVKF